MFVVLSNIFYLRFQEYLYYKARLQITNSRIIKLIFMLTIPITAVSLLVTYSSIIDMIIIFLLAYFLKIDLKEYIDKLGSILLSIINYINGQEFQGIIDLFMEQTVNMKIITTLIILELFIIIATVIISLFKDIFIYNFKYKYQKN